MAVVTLPEIVWLTPLRLVDPEPPWTTQPGGGPDMLVGDIMEASEIAEATITEVQREVASFALGAPQLQPRKLRPYQSDCVDAVFRAFANGKRAPLIVLATGGGKTLIAAEIIRRLRDENPGFSYRIWFLAHRKKLLDQAYRTIKLVAPEVTAGFVQGARRDVGKFLTLGSIDTLANRARFEETISGRGEHGVQARAPNLIVIDECHHSTSAKYQRIVEWARAANPEVKLLGMTATPGRTDGTALDKVFDGVAYERNTFQLINDGALVPPRGTRVELKVNLDVIPTEDGEFKRAPLSKVMSQPDVMKAVVDGYLQYGEGKKLLGFCVTVKHAHDLAECFRQQNVPARAVDGGMKEEEQDAMLAAFSEGKTRVLLSCDLLTEGYDDPSAQGVLMARPTNSQLVYIQAIGRALRPAPGKSDALVLDCVGNSQRHQLAQLASLAGLVPIDEGRGTSRLPGEEIEMGDATVQGYTGHAIDFRVLRQRTSKWSWVETRFGWTVSIPRVGYFLLAWCANDRSLVDVKFHDMRDGHRDKAPHVLSTRLDFEMAYGLVEQEIERLFTARTSRSRFKDRDATDAGPEVDATRQAMEQGVNGELFSPEDMMRSGADWRDKETSDRQRAALIEIGVKPESVPKTAGEASDLFSVMTIERNAKAREPATQKQRAFLIGHRLATSEEIDAMTKKQAQALIVRRLKELEARKRADARFEDDAPPLEDEDNVGG